MKRLLVAVMTVLLLAGCGTPTHGGRAHSAGFGTPPHGDYGLHPHQLAAVPQILGFDAVTITNIPSNAPAVGCYTSGRYANCGAAQLRFPHAHIVTIATWTGASGRCADTEPGDLTPAQDAGWIKRMLSLHVYRPCVYSDSSEMRQVQADLAAAGLARGQYTLWLADWDRNPAIPAGYDAKQWNSTATLDYDSFATSFFSTPPKPKPTVQHCLRQPYPKTASCRRVRYGYHKTLVDLRKLNRLIRAHHCTASHHPRYCAGWVYWDHRRALQIRAFVKRYA